MKFALNNKDVDSIKHDGPEDGSWYEFERLNDDHWALFEHMENHVTELITLTEKDWGIIWKMLTEK